MKDFARRGRHRCRRPRPARSGFTLIELAIATSILMIGIVSVLSASSQMHSLRKHNRERTLAQNAVRSMAERIHAASHGFSDDPASWAGNVLALYGPGGNLGPSFAVQGLTPEDGAAFVGSIQIVTSETETDANLGIELGLPRDLDGDGDDDDPDVSASARILPVILTLRWRGENGARTLRHGFYLLGY